MFHPNRHRHKKSRPYIWPTDSETASGRKPTHRDHILGFHRRHIIRRPRFCFWRWRFWGIKDQRLPAVFSLLAIRQRTNQNPSLSVSICIFLADIFLSLPERKQAGGFRLNTCFLRRKLKLGAVRTPSGTELQAEKRMFSHLLLLAQHRSVEGSSSPQITVFVSSSMCISSLAAITEIASPA